MIAIYGYTPPDLCHSGWHHPPDCPVLLVRHRLAVSRSRAARGYTDVDSHRRADGYADRRGHPATAGDYLGDPAHDSHAPDHRHALQHAYVYADAQSLGDGNRYADANPDADGNPDGHGDCDVDSHTHRDPDADGDSDGNSYCNRDPDTDGNGGRHRNRHAGGNGHALISGDDEIDSVDKAILAVKDAD